MGLSLWGTVKIVGGAAGLTLGGAAAIVGAAAGPKGMIPGLIVAGVGGYTYVSGIKTLIQADNHAEYVQYLFLRDLEACARDWPDANHHRGRQ